MWRYTVENRFDNITLHDCVASKIYIKDDDFIFEFEDGFWIGNKCEYNPHVKVLKTSAAQVQLCAADEIDFCYFKKPVFSFFKSHDKRICVEFDEVIEKVNSGEWQLEFLYEYSCDKLMLFECYLWMVKKDKRKGYQAQLKAYIPDYKLCWNEICPDREW